MKKCPICGNKQEIEFEIQNSRYNKVFKYYRCVFCSHINIQPKLSEKVLFQNYPYDENDQSTHPFMNKLVNSIFSSKVYENLFTSKRFIKNGIQIYKEKNKTLPKSYLDYGSGNSKSTLFFKEFIPNSTSEGFEKAQEAKSMSGIKIYKEEQSLLSSKRKYDVVSLFHVLEHISDFSHFFSILDAVTNKKSIIIFQIPQASSLDIFAIPYLKNDFILRNPYHLNLFTEKSIKIFLMNYGYKVVALNYEIYQTHSLIENKNILFKILMTPLLLVISVLEKFFKISNVITVYAQKK